MHQKAGRRNTDLPGIAQLGGAHGFDGQIHVCIFGNDDRRVTAQLHGAALHVRTCHGRQLLAHGRGTRKRHLADGGVGIR